MKVKFDAQNGEIFLKETSNLVYCVEPLYNIGDSLLGGVVVYIFDDSGEHGLIAATGNTFEDLPYYEYNWSANGETIPDCSGTSIGLGSYNTDQILAYSTYSLSGYTGAEGIKVYVGSDWFLPSKDEFEQMMIQKDFCNLSSTSYYLTSSQGTLEDTKCWTWWGTLGFRESTNVIANPNHMATRAARYF